MFLSQYLNKKEKWLKKRIKLNYSLKMKKNQIFFIFLILVLSCKQKSDPDTPSIARYKNSYLYYNDIADLIPKNITPSDSIEFVKLYINKWLENKIIVDNAIDILPPQDKDFSEKIKEYKNALLQHEWEKKIVLENLDTIVDNTAIIEYYNKNKHEFILRESILRVIYIKLNANSPHIQDARKIITNAQIEKKEIERFCRKYAVNYFTELKSWLYFNDLLKEIPINEAQKESIYKGDNFISLEDEQYTYLLKILDFKLEGTISPLALEKNTIKEIILQKRKNEIIKQELQKLKNKAYSDKNIELFD